MRDPFACYREVISYRRFSSAGQATGASEDRQLDTATAWAAQHGITLSTLSSTDRGLSGFHGDHLSDGAFGKLLAGLESGAIATPALLLVEATDRFGRLPSTEALQLLLGRLFANGADLFVIDKGLHVTRERFNADLGIQVQLLAEFHGAHQFSARLSARMLDAHRRGRESIAAGQAVRTGWAPHWITLTEDGTWALNSYAATVLRLVELLEAGHGQTITAQRLTAEGHLTPRGRAWTPGTISHIAYSPAIAGGRILQRRTGEVVWGYWPAVIERPRREALLQRLARRDPASGLHGQQDQRLWVGQGLTCCAACGRPVGVRTASCRVDGVKTKLAYIRCRGRIYRKCDQPAVRLPLAQASLLTRLSSHQLRGLFPSTSPTTITKLRSDETQAQQALQEARAMVTVADAELTRAMAAEPGLVTVLARHVAAAEQRVVVLESEALQKTHARQEAESSEAGAGVAELQRLIGELFRAFALGEDTVADRKLVHQQLQALDLRITVDAAGERLGLSIGAGPIDWQPLTGLATAALQAGETDRVYGQLQQGDIRRDEAGLWLRLEGQWALLEEVPVSTNAPSGTPG